MNDAARTVSIGTSDFREVRNLGHYYVDKSLLIPAVLEDRAKVLLLPRPRRFGKTLNLSMLYYFFRDDQDNRALFHGLAITSDKKTMAQLGSRPTVFLTFKDLKAGDWATCLDKLKWMIAKLFEDHQATLFKAQPTGMTLLVLRDLLEGKGNIAACEQALSLLTELLCRATGKQVVVLIDEYDAPVHAGYQFGYFQEISQFMRNFLSGGLKDNPNLAKGILSGILRVAKDASFSGLNNLQVYSLIDEPFSEFFGFTEQEVHRILSDTGQETREAEVKSWYNGYRFGNQIMYNPWSIMSMASQPHKPLDAYWVNTADNAMIKEQASPGQNISLEALECLLRGETVRQEIEVPVALGEFTEDSIWSLLLFSGFLTFDQKLTGLPTTCDLRIPNFEVRSFYDQLVKKWMGRPGALLKLHRALLDEDLDSFALQLSEIIRNLLSYHDLAGPEQERIYHALMLGMLVSLLPSFKVVSNRESGHGRFDLALVPRDSAHGGTGFLFEFKRASEGDLEKVAQAALAQIIEREYMEPLKESVARMVLIGIAFSGKRLALAHRTWPTLNLEAVPLTLVKG